jgi:hypothetical protein
MLRGIFIRDIIVNGVNYISEIPVVKQVDLFLKTFFLRKLIADKNLKSLSSLCNSGFKL